MEKAWLGRSKEVDKQGRCSSFVGIANAQHVEQNFVHEEAVRESTMVGRIAYQISEIWESVRARFAVKKYQGSQGIYVQGCRRVMSGFLHAS